MLRLFRQYPDAIRRTQEIAEACTFSLDELKYEYPEEITSEGRTPQEELTFPYHGRVLKNYYGEIIPDKINMAIEHELIFIEEMNYAAYFLTVYDIVRFARSASIFFARDGDLQLILPFVIAWALLLLIPPNSICSLNVLFPLPEMNHRILMWTLSMNGGKK